MFGSFAYFIGFNTKIHVFVNRFSIYFNKNFNKTFQRQTEAIYTLHKLDIFSSCV